MEFIHRGVASKNGSQQRSRKKRKQRAQSLDEAKQCLHQYIEWLEQIASEGEESIGTRGILRSLEGIWSVLRQEMTYQEWCELMGLFPVKEIPDWKHMGKERGE